MRKTLTLVLVVVGSIGSTGALAYFLHIDQFSFAWALNFLLMICAFSFTEVLNSRLSSSYYNERQWERRGKIYELLGINLFRKVLVWIGWEKLNKKNNPVERKTEALMNLHHQTKKSELGHAIVFPVVLGFSVYVALKFGVIRSFWLIALNILLNLYPVFLQRYNRPRIERALTLSKRTDSARKLHVLINNRS
jgi:hypothetical protein